MSKNEKIADTLGKHKWRAPTIVWRDLCRALADDLGLEGGERETFLRTAKAFEP